MSRFLALIDEAGESFSIRENLIRKVMPCHESGHDEPPMMVIFADALFIPEDGKKPFPTIEILHVRWNDSLLVTPNAEPAVPVLQNLQPPTSIFAKPANPGVQEAYYNGRGALMGVLKGQPFLMADPPADWEDADIVEVHGMTADKILLRHQKSDVTGWHDMLKDDLPQRDLGNLLPADEADAIDPWNDPDLNDPQAEIASLREEIEALKSGHTH